MCHEEAISVLGCCIHTYILLWNLREYDDYDGDACNDADALI